MNSIGQKIFNAQKANAGNASLIGLNRRYQIQDKDDEEYAIDERLNAFLQKETMTVVGDLHGSLLKVNAKFCVVTEYSEAELLAHGLRFYSTSGRSSNCLQDLCPKNMDSPTWYGEFFIISRHNKVRWFESAIVVCADSYGQKFQYMAIHHEMTHKKAAELALSISREQLRELNVNQHRQVESERQRFARDIHDELGQYLLALKNDIASLNQDISECQPQLQHQSLRASKLVDMAMLSVRSIINDIRPPILQLGIIAALEWQVCRFQQRTGITCEFIRTIEDVEMLPDKTLAIFRVMQEALVNVQKHAKAKKVQVLLIVDNGELQINVIDDGVGLAADHSTKLQSFGLLGMQERLLAHGGHLSLRNIGTCSSHKMPFKSGTHLLAKIPV